jgi:hypothetical protein
MNDCSRNIDFEIIELPYSDKPHDMTIYITLADNSTQKTVDVQKYGASM